MTYDELMEKVAKIVVNNNLFKVPSRTTAEEIIDTIRETIETLDANQEQIGFEIAFDSFEMLNGEPFLQTDVAQRMFSAMLAASPLGEKGGDQ